MKLNKKGFTILELLIATTVFSVILLVATTGIIRIGNLYYKNIISSRTQEAIRSINSEISTALQFSSGGVTLPSTPSSNYFCIDNTRYRYNINSKVPDSGGIDTTKGLIQEGLNPGDNCNSVIVVFQKQLLGKNMRLLKFGPPAQPAGSDLWTINLKIAYGEDDLLSNYDNNGSLIVPAVALDTVSCKSGISGSSFCATALLDTTVKKRLN